MGREEEIPYVPQVVATTLLCNPLRFFFISLFQTHVVTCFSSQAAVSVAVNRKVATPERADLHVNPESFTFQSSIKVAGDKSAACVAGGGKYKIAFYI